MKSNTFLFVIATVIAGISAESCMQSKMFHEELGCVPFFKNSGDNCPFYYDCTAYHNKPKNKCHLRGKYYNAGDQIRDENLIKNCIPECECYVENGEYKLECVESECPEWIDPEGMISPGCKPKYSLEFCCIMGEVCPEQQQLVQCTTSNNRTFLEGSRYFSESREETCVCTRDNNGKAKEECRRNVCTNEIVFPSEIDQYCAPVYRHQSNVCPTSMLCASEYMPETTVKETDNEPKCRYGNRYLSIAQKFVHINMGRKTNCECKIPPYVSCNQY